MASSCTCFFDGIRPADQALLESVLSRAGLAAHCPKQSTNGIPILYFFDRDSDRAVSRTAELSVGGTHRLLAVSTRSSYDCELAWDLIRAGASDVLAWNEHDEPDRAITARLDRWSAVDRLIEGPPVRDNLIGKSPSWVNALRQLVELAHYNTGSVLILGETGTGKELAARLIHTLDSRKTKGDLVVLDCTTIMPDLAGSEFFGHEKGSFTGAMTARDGAFSFADKGTLFLDEVGELPLVLQAQLLRVIQHGTYRRVGSSIWRRTSFRLICATNRDLWAGVKNGTFRSDLYHRIATHTVTMPSLKERPTDIPILTEHFMRTHRPDSDPPALDEAVRNHLLSRPYPGNVRELQHLVARIMHRHVGPGKVSIGDLPPEEVTRARPDATVWMNGSLEQAIDRAVLQEVPLDEIGRVAKDVAVRLALLQEDGNQRRAAQRLGVTERALQMRRAGKR